MKNIQTIWLFTMTTAVCRLLSASSSYNLIVQSRKINWVRIRPDTNWSYSNRIWLVRQYRKLNESEQQNKPQKSYRLENDDNKLLGGLLAQLSQRLIGELVGYPWSGVRPSSSVGVVHNAQTSFSPKVLGQSKPDCMRNLLG